MQFSVLTRMASVVVGIWIVYLREIKYFESILKNRSAIIRCFGDIRYIEKQILLEETLAMLGTLKDESSQGTQGI